MADLPANRTEGSLPFTKVSFNVFGPWMAHTPKTHKGSANSKRWGLVGDWYSHLKSSAFHIQVLESMDTGSFISTPRRLFALCSPVSLLRRDRGTNFSGGKLELEDTRKEMDKCKVETSIKHEGCEWMFNPPHASHYGGAWEHQIGTVRSRLHTMFAEFGSPHTTNELLITLMALVTAIVIVCPMSATQMDADEP